MDRESLSSLVYLASIALFVFTGFAAIVGLPQRVFSDRKRYKKSSIVRAIWIILCLIVVGAMGV